jgi:hypothetical protein
MDARQAGMEGGDERRGVGIALRWDSAMAIERTDMGEDVGDAMAAQLVGQRIVGLGGLDPSDPAMLEP